MKRIVVLLMAIFCLCLLICGCDKEDEKRVILPTVRDSHISDYLSQHPRFNPYNAITDSDNEYIYCIQNVANYPNTGIYRKPIHGEKWELVYENEISPYSKKISDNGVEVTTRYIPPITSIAVNSDSIYFSRKDGLFRINKDGSDVTYIPHSESDSYQIKALRIVNENSIYLGMSFEISDGKVMGVFSYSDIATFRRNRVDKESPNPFIAQLDYYGSLSYANDVYLEYQTGREDIPRPWNELLSPTWKITDENLNDNTLTVSTPCTLRFTDASNVTTDYEIDGSTTQFLIDYDTQTIIFIDDLYPEDSKMHLHFLGVDGFETSDTYLTLDQNKFINWYNAKSGWIYGLTEDSRIVAYEYTSDRIIYSDVQNICGYIDAMDGLVYFRNIDNLTLCWEPTTNEISAIK